MITGKLRQDVDRLWEEFWTGGITNPLTVIEQISFLMFSRMLDIRENINERKAKRLKGKSQVKMIFGPKEQELRWNQFKLKPAAEMLDIVRNKVFPHFRTVGNSGSTFSEYMADAQCLIQKPSLLVSAVGMVDKLPIEDSDSKGDLYEYLLGKLTTAGINGQFRTPRHIIKMMVELIAPKPTDIIGDPACGTGGFLAGALEYIYRTNTSKAGLIVHEDEDGNKNTTYSADKLNPDELRHVQSNMFYGFDFDATMLRIASMNLILHGLENPNIHYCDTLANAMPEKFPKLAQNYFDVILANPPFKGSLDFGDVHSSLTGKVKTKKTELLFLILMLRMLKTGGRCAVIVPDGVLFGSSNAHRSLRQLLVDDNQLEAVISLPAGVFKPYAGVSTAVLVFAKGGKTDKVFYYDVERDGFSLDDKRTPLPEKDKDGRPNSDLPDAVEKWQVFAAGRNKKQFDDRTTRAFFVTRDEIAAQEYDLSIGRYKEHVYEEAKHDPPKVILSRLKDLEKEIASDICKLEGILK
ncbi:MAG: SAM-dependent DNA methyltransferase [Pirellulales bacterium]|nr:SAM-dependent DNA methyltransferase [Pirellulales bacterium]